MKTPVRLLNEKAELLRGKVINRTIFLERCIDTYIAKHFCPSNKSKIEEMQLLLLGNLRTSFGSKIEVFEFLAKKHNSKWYNNYKAIRKDMNRDLDFVITQRNIIAHQLLEATEQYITSQTVAFVNFKNKAETTEYKDQSIYELLTIIENLTDYIFKKVKTITPRSNVK